MTQPASANAPQTLPALLAQRAATTPAATAQWRLVQHDQWQSNDWQAFFATTARVAAALRSLGLAPGDRLGIMAPASAEWDLLQLAALAAGAVVVGLDIHEHDQRLAETLALCELSALAVANESALARLPQIAKDRLRLLVAITPQSFSQGVLSWDDLLAAADPGAEWLDLSQPEATALIVFTSGTTGAPKGIAYTHRQVMLACNAILDAFPDIGAGAHLPCWLPLSNLFQRMINFCAIARGAEIYYVENPRDIMRHLPRIAPHVFIAVPRFYEKFFMGIRARLETKARWQQQLFGTALELARHIGMQRRNGARVSLLLKIAHVVLDTLALRPVRNAMGGQLRFLVSGSAPLPQWLLVDMAALGLPVYEAYGMSENIVPICVNRPNAVCFGSVGKPLPPNEIHIAADGELLVRGPGVFSGYLGEPPAARDADGFLATGDYAEQDAAGFVALTGRKSEIFKTSTGRRVAPSGIENLVKQVPHVEQCMVLGASRPFVVAIVWIDAKHLTHVIAGIFYAVRAAVSSLPDYQRPAGLIISTRTLSLDRGEITPNLKLRRRQIEQNYAADIDRLYLQMLNQPEAKVVVTNT